jgi:hypothetical protein
MSSTFRPTLAKTGQLIFSLLVAWMFAIIISPAIYADNGNLPLASSPVFTPAPGIFTGPQKVTISSTQTSVTIYYTIDGTVPKSTSQIYTVPIDVTTSIKLTALAVDPIRFGPSKPTSGYYEIGTQLPKAEAPTFTPAPNTFTKPQKVTISSTQSGVSIYYTTDGTPPTTASTKYYGPIDVVTSMKLSAIAVYHNRLSPSDPTSGYYVINAQQVAKPTLSPTPSTTTPFTAPVTVTISCATPNAIIRYTTTGTAPTANSPVYNGPFTVSATTKVEARAFLVGSLDSDPAVGYYVISAPTQVATPTFSPAPGTSFTAPVQVTINCTTPNAVIRYTTNGTNPTASSPIYTGAFTVSATTKVQARAFLVGSPDSNPAVGYYVITAPVQKIATPVFTVAPGTFTTPQKVGITCATPGAIIRYTSNGTAPTATSPLYTTAAFVNSTTTINVKAFKPGMTDSDTLTGTFTIKAAAITQGVDLMIKTNTTGASVGEGVIDTQGTQVATKTAASRRIASYVIALKNTGTAVDYYAITGVGSKVGWTVNYIDMAGLNVTQKVTGGYGWIIPQVLPGKVVYFRLDVTPTSGIANDDSVDVVITATSKIDSTKTDQVTATTTKVK